MALILAIEPDRRQANQLTAMVRGRLDAELVLAESAERALSALGDRVPDLVLTSALLSPKDETTLGERLRALDGHAAHVQTLTIPVLATTSGRGSGRASGVLGALRRDKKKKSSAPHGCDPAVFADQCKEYLERAASERAAALEQAAVPRIKEPVRPVTPSPVTGAEWVVVKEEAVVADEIQDLPAEPVSEFESAATTVIRSDERAPIYTPPEYRASPSAAAPIEEPSVDASAEFIDAPVETPAATVAPHDEVPAVSPGPPAFFESPAGEASESAPRVDRALREFLDLTAAETEGPASLLAAVAALEAEERSYAAAAAAPTTDPPAESPAAAEPDYFDLSSLLQPASTPTDRKASVYGQEPAVDVYEIDAEDLTTPFDTTGEATRADQNQLASLTDLEAIFTSSPDFAQPATTAAPAPTPPAPPTPPPANDLENLKEWDDIVEALRRDAEQLEARQPAANDATNTAPPAPRIELPRIDIPPLVAKPAASEPAPAKHAPAEPAPAKPHVPEPTAHTSPAQATDGADSEANGAKRRRKRAKPTPAQDEWGFFDPDQCGFAALIEKLEEINDQDDPPKPRGA